MRKIIAIPDFEQPERCELFHYAHEGIQREWVDREALKVLIDGNELIFAIRGITYSLIRVEAPKMSRHQLKKALPFLAEPFCARPIEDCHFTLVGMLCGIVSILVLEKKRMDRYIAYFEGLDIIPSALVPLSFLIGDDVMPCEVMTDSGIYLALHEHERYVYGLSEREAFLRSLGSDSYSVIDCQGDKKTAFAKILTPKTVPNVLQGEYRMAPTHSSSRMRIRWLLGVAIVLGVVLIGEKWMIKSRYQEKILNQHQRIVNIYKQHFPHASAVVAPLHRMRQLFESQNISDQNKWFFSAMKNAAAVLPQEIDMQSIEYRSHHLVLRFMRTESVNSSTLLKGLQTHGYEVRYDTVHRDGAIFVQLTLEGKAND